MNQYIITEEELAEMVCDFYNGFFSAGSDIATTVRSHPYQSERDKMLDELEKRITEEEPVFLFTILGYIKELRQAGEPSIHIEFQNTDIQASGGSGGCCNHEEYIKSIRQAGSP